MLLQDKVLVHYDPYLPLVRATDSSSHGLGTVLSDRTPDRQERKTHFLRIPHVRDREVLTDRERGLVFGVGCEEVSKLLRGSPLHPSFRSSTP